MPAPYDIGGIAGVTTDVDGYATVPHSLGVIPGEVLVTPRYPIAGGDIPGMVLTDRPTTTTFRVRALHTNGTPLANIAIRFGWHAWAAPAPVAGPFKRAIQYFIGTGEGGLACTGPGVGHRKDIVIHWNMYNDTCDLAAIRTANPGARVWAYQNFEGMIAGPHTDGLPTTAVTQEEANAQESAMATLTPTLNYTVSGGPSPSGCTNSAITVQADGTLHDVGGASAPTTGGTSPAIAPQTATYWNDTPGVWDSVRWTERIIRDPQLVPAGYYWANQGHIAGAAGSAGSVWYAGLQSQGNVPPPFPFTGRTINFAIWNGVAARAGDIPNTYAGPFSEFGTGHRVVAPYAWAADRTYTLRCQADPAEGARWFTLYVKDELTGVETRVGSIQAATSDSSKLWGTSYQFSELFIQSTPAATCAELPRATAFIGKPVFATAGYADSWFLHRADNGAHVAFNDYPYLMAANPGSLSWQEQAKAHLDQIKKHGFDGVCADDVNVGAPNHGIAYGTAVREYATVDEYAAATVAAFQNYAAAAHAHGLLVAANVGMNPWEAAPRAKSLQLAGTMDLYMREFFTRWNGTGGNFFGADWESNISLVKEVNQAGAAFMAVTQYGPGPQGATADARYGVASFWVARTGAKSDAWTHGTADHYTAEWGRDIGAPIDADRVAVGVGGYQRRYTLGIAAVNTGASGSITFDLGEPYIDPSGASVTSVTLGPTSGMVLYK